MLEVLDYCPHLPLYFPKNMTNQEKHQRYYQLIPGSVLLLQHNLP